MDVAISIVNRNGLAMLKECVGSLLASDIKKHLFTFYIWDNDSTDGAKEYWDKLDAKKIIHLSPTNQGIVGPRIALGSDIVKGKHTHMLEIHSDMKFPRQWFFDLVDGADESVGINMPFIINGASRGDCLLDDHELELQAESNREDLCVNNCLQVHPWLVSVACMREVGYYRSEFVGHVCEDDDFVWRVKESRFQIRATKRSIVQHIGGASGGSSMGNTNAAFQIFQGLNGISRDEFYSMMRQEGGHPIVLL